MSFKHYYVNKMLRAMEIMKCMLRGVHISLRYLIVIILVTIVIVPRQ